MPRPQKTYHHGDLRRALLQAAEQELAEAGIDGFTLRACARRAGVSHAAPAHHFGNAEGLLAALAIDAFSRLAESMRMEIETAEPGSRGQVLAAARGYLRFALDNPALFQLMFRLQGATVGSAEVRNAGQAAFGIAAQAVGAFRRVPDPMADARLADEVIGVWALAHGVADLALTSQFGAPGSAGQEIEAMLERLVDSLLGPPGTTP